MNHRVQFRSEQDHVLLDSLAGSSMSALTLVVAITLIAWALPQPPAPPDEDFVWPPDIIRVFVPPPPGGDPVPPVTPPVVAAIIPGLDEQADTALVERTAPTVRGPDGIGDDPGNSRGQEGGSGSTPVIEPDIPPHPIYVPHDEIPVVARRVVPDYPDIAQQAGMEGEVMIQIFVGTDGRVHRAEVVTRASIFDDAALAAVRQWVFTPAKANGHPVGVWMAVPIVFRLH